MRRSRRRIRAARHRFPPGSGRQTTLYEYAWLVIFRYVPLPDRCRSLPARKRRGLSERELRRKLERRGWSVWRGGLLNILRRDELYPVVRRKYARLKGLLGTRHPGAFELLEYLCAVHHGMPDFLCHHPAKGFRFVECKLGHEQLSQRQKRCIRKLQTIGFDVEVWKLVERCTKAREAEVNLENGAKNVTDAQARLTKKLVET